MALVMALNSEVSAPLELTFYDERAKAAIPGPHLTAEPPNLSY
jgi:hypothetical protein